MSRRTTKHEPLKVKSRVATYPSAAVADLLKRLLDGNPQVGPNTVGLGATFDVDLANVRDLVSRGQLLLVHRDTLARVVELLQPGAKE